MLLFILLNNYTHYNLKYHNLRSGKASFFTEEPIYWDPENNTKGIYEQLAQKKYREIPRHEIR